MVNLFDNDRTLFWAFIYMLSYCIWFGIYSVNVWQHCMELFEAEKRQKSRKENLPLMSQGYEKI